MTYQWTDAVITTNWNEQNHPPYTSTGGKASENMTNSTTESYNHALYNHAKLCIVNRPNYLSSLS